jgi:oxygen-dependent protoporphyrinogen oxidase
VSRPGRADAVVVGAGITGLAAARALALEGARVTVLDPAPPGGKLRTTPFDGGALDEAADAFLARVPEGVALCRDLGLEGDLVSPTERRAHVVTRGVLRRLPHGQVLGVPTDLEELAASGIMSPEGLERARRDLTTPLVAPEGDPTIGATIRERLGDEVAERLVDPLVGGINAGDTDELSLAATVPQLDAAVRSGAPSLIEACQAQRAANPDPDAPVFFAPRGGLGALVHALVADLDRRGVALVPRAAVALEGAAGGWRVTDEGGGAHDAAAVVVTTAAGTAARLVEAHAPEASALLAAIPYASVGMLAFAVAREAIDRELDGSGYLVPRVEGRLLTACSWVSAKWPHLHGDGTVWLRASVGRDGDTRALALDDEALVAAVRADLADTMALHGPVQEVRVTRWPGSFPQYRPGHLQRADAIDADLAARAPGLAVAGAALRGLGIPACIRQGSAAAARVLRAS